MQRKKSNDIIEVSTNEQTKPLIGGKTSNDNTRESKPLGEYSVRHKDFNEEEEATKIDMIMCLEESTFKKVMIVPILAICTLFFFLLFMYWYPTLRRVMLYNRCRFERATHLFIEGARKIFIS